MDKRSWIIASVLSVLLVVGLISFSAWRARSDLDRAGRELAGARAASDRAQAQLDAMKKETEEARAKIEELRQEKEQAGKVQKSLEDEMRASLESKDVTISQLQGKLTVTILDRILFDSGEAELRGEGERVLRQIAAVLAQFPRRQIHVIGHTDNVPIRAGARGVMRATGNSRPRAPRPPCGFSRRRRRSIRAGWGRWATGSFIQSRTTARRRDAPKTAGSRWWCCRRNRSWRMCPRLRRR